MGLDLKLFKPEKVEVEIEIVIRQKEKEDALKKKGQINKKKEKHV